MVTIEIVVQSVRVMGVRVAISCRYVHCPRGDAFVSSLLYFEQLPQEVIKVTYELANKTSAGYDNISVNLMKKILQCIVEPLSVLISK